MLLFILESIGTSELILIGIIALIFLGPRKLPQIARTIGKTMADFRNTTNEFKSTWQREVDFEEEVSALRTGELPHAAPSPVPRNEPALDSSNSIASPSIKPIQTDLFDNVPVEAKPGAEKNDDTPVEDDLSDKRNWL
jgi:sec-independent protein translocase protein TatB